MAVSLGAKATNLVRLRDELHLHVPTFVALPFAELIDEFESLAAAVTLVTGNYLAGKTSLESTTAILEAVLETSKLSEVGTRRFKSELAKFANKKVSFRTSAALEDGEQSSFAGQYESFLDLPYSRENLETYALKCLASMVSAKVLNYAKSRGLRQFVIGGSLIVQEMFYGRVSGVIFTANGRGQLQIAYSNSWQNTVVEGENATEILVDRADIEVSHLPAHLAELCKTALQIEYAAESPVDIEWAYDGTKLAYLQFRPITQVNLEYRMEWDSTNISENYPGITLPLTYSLIRQFYAGVYLAFFKMLGARPSDVEAKRHIADNMLGYLNGRVYYRISNWYEAIKLLPGRSNQEFFEAMLNPVEKRGGGARNGGSNAVRPLPDARSLLAIVRFGRLVLSSERRSRQFSEYIAKKIAFYDAVDFAYINAAAILDASKRLRTEILSDWAVTILNDIRLMVFHGLLKRLFEKTANPDDYMALMQGLADRASIKPLAALRDLGLIASSALQAEKVWDTETLVGTASWAAVKRAAGAYVTAYGARTPGELKLENQRITDDLHQILALALKATNSEVSAAPAGQVGKSTFSWPSEIKPITRPLVKWIAKNTRQAIDWRERFRFNRAQTFNLSRKAFDAIGAILTREGMLETPRDIYWLTDQEVDELVNGHAPVQSAKAQVANRKLEFADYEKVDQGLAVAGAGLIAAAHLKNVETKRVRTGIFGNGVAPGLVTAEAVVMTAFDPSQDVRGKVLVVHYIDPGWTLLFTQAAAIVAERGNALSHAAIIAREIGIPCVVGAVGATTHVKTGQVITVNGSNGSIDHE